MISCAIWRLSSRRSEDSVLDALPVSTDYNVILTARTPGTLPSALWESSYVIYMD